MEHECRRVAVDVRAGQERLAQVRVAGDVGQDPQLDLAVVGRHERHVGGARHDGAPDPAAQRRPDRDVLEVRVGGGEPPGGGHRLVERRVQAPIVGEQLRQGRDVRAAKLRVEAPVQQLRDGRMRGPEILEHRRVGREAGLRAPPLRQVELVEQDLLQLLGAAQGELVTHVGEDLGLQARQLTRELDVQEAERREIDGDARRLHAGEDRDQRQLQPREEPVERCLPERVRKRTADGERGKRLQPRPCGRG